MREGSTSRCLRTSLFRQLPAPALTHRGGALRDRVSTPRFWDTATPNVLTRAKHLFRNSQQRGNWPDGCADGASRHGGELARCPARLFPAEDRWKGPKRG